MAWFKRKSKPPISAPEPKKVQMPEGVWTKCKNCDEIIYSKEIERNLNVCPKCDYHFRISARTRIELLLDDGSFEEMDAGMTSVDFLNFKDSKKYKERTQNRAEEGRRWRRHCLWRRDHRRSAGGGRCFRFRFHGRQYGIGCR